MIIQLHTTLAVSLPDCDVYSLIWEYHIELPPISELNFCKMFYVFGDG